MADEPGRGLWKRKLGEESGNQERPLHGFQGWHRTSVVKMSGYTWNRHEMCMEYAWNMYGTCVEYVQNMQGLGIDYA